MTIMGHSRRMATFQNKVFLRRVTYPEGGLTRAHGMGRRTGQATRPVRGFCAPSASRRGRPRHLAGALDCVIRLAIVHSITQSGSLRQRLPWRIPAYPG